MSGDLGGDLAQALAGKVSGKVADHILITAKHHVVDYFCAQQIGGAIFHFSELRADPCFKWEATQETGTKRMDRLNLQPARCLDCACKKHTRDAQAFGINRP